MKFDFTSGVVLLGTAAALGTALVITTIGSPEATRNVEHLFAFVNGRTDVLEIDESTIDDSTAAETTATATVTSYDSATTAQSITTYETTTLTAAPTADLTTTSPQYTVVSVANVEVNEQKELKDTEINSLGEEITWDLRFVDKDDLDGQAILYIDRASNLDLRFCCLADSTSSQPSRFRMYLKSGDEESYREIKSFDLTKDSLPHTLSLSVPDKSFLLIQATNTGEYCFGARYRIGCSIQSSPVTSK